MTTLHSETDPTMLIHLTEMLESAGQPDIALGYFFVSGFAQISEEIFRLKKTRDLMGRADRATFEAVAAYLHQARPPENQLEVNRTVRRSQRSIMAAEAADGIAKGVAALSQSDGNEKVVDHLRQLVTAGVVEINTGPRELLHAKTYLCWYENRAEAGAALVGSSNFTLAGFQDNTKLNVRVTGVQGMRALREWFDTL